MDQAQESYPFEKRDYYPHMKPNDVLIWHAFIDKYPASFDFVQYDVPCGSGPQFDTLINEETGGHVEKLYKRKIDVVAFKGDEITIIEVKPRAGASAVGQVKMYRKLYIQDYSPPRYPDCVIITDEEIADVREYGRDEGVKLIVV